MADVFSRLLLATEHGEFDTGAEALAFALARRCALPLRAVLPLVSNPEYEMVAPQIAAQAEAEAARRRLDLEAQALRAGVAFDPVVRRGPEPYLEIVEEARERGTDLIVIRRRGRRGLLANLLVGEMVRNVVAHAPCSVLIAPPGACMWSQRVLVGIDPAAPDAGLVDRAAEVSRTCGLPLSLVAVAAGEALRSPAQQALDDASRQVRGHWDRVDGEVRIGRPHAELIGAARQHGADLLVIGRHAGDGGSHAWIGGAAEKVIGMAECPVLIHVPAPTPPRE